MKKIISALLICVMLFALASCSTLSGSYANESGTLTYTFDGDEVTIKGKVLLVSIEFSGTYEIGTDDDGNKTITFKFEGSGSDTYSGTHDYTTGKDSELGAYISIDGVRFYKQK